MGISRQEFMRRHDAVRRMMKEEQVDCLVIAGRSDYFARGNVRYVTHLPFGGYVLFPAEGKPIYFLSTNQISSPKHDKAGPVRELVEFKELKDPVAQLLSEVRGFEGGRKIGLVGLASLMPVPVYLALKDAYGNRLMDASHLFDALRSVKSGEEIARMRAAASVADEVCLMLRDMVRPGLSDYEIYGEVKKAIYARQCEYSMELIDAAGSTMNMAWSPSGDRLEENGTLFLEITPAYDGSYAQLPVSLPVGRYSPSVAKKVDVWAEAMDAATGLLRPDTVVADIHRQVVNVIERRGLLSPYPLGHTIGLDVMDSWTIHAGNQTVLRPGMTLAFHPSVLSEPGGEGIGMGYTYLVTEEGAEKLSSIDLYAFATA
ncbi:MAG: aminopeptidase P family protein [Deltaproteobacteria bacterium]|nr:aminopeptidase P family protein [Deltaproteobacteria bacterium]